MTVPRPVPVEAPIQPLTITSTDTDRGRALVHGVATCTDCHGADLTGETFIDGFPMGRLVGPNLTRPDRTPEQWVAAIHHGIDTAGDAILMMPDYALITQADLAAMVAYLGSLTPSGEILPASRLGPIGRMLVRKGEWRYAAEHIDHAAPIPTDEGDRGAYLVTLSGCIDCHGGGAGQGFGPGQPPSTNITPHADGLGNWSFAEFDRAMRTGATPDNRTLDSMMPWAAYAGWSAEDMQAAWNHLQTLEPLPSPD